MMSLLISIPREYKANDKEDIIQKYITSDKTLYIKQHDEFIPIGQILLSNDHEMEVLINSSYNINFDDNNYVISFIVNENFPCVDKAYLKNIKN